MNIRLSGRALGIWVCAALLTGCAGAQSQFGTPVMRATGSHVRFAKSGAERVLYSFSGGNDGGNAATGLVFDPQGNLFGTTVVGGRSACGTVFKLAPQPKRWQETVLYSFDCGATGKNPHGGVTFDPQGNLDGTTVAGGSGGSCTGDGCGIVFQLTSSGENVLHSFTAGDDGFGPGSAVVFAAAGDLFGTTPDGGKDSDGTVYEISGTGSQSRERVIHSFTGGKDGGTGSLGALLVDTAGSLYGVTETGGAHSAGTVFKLSRASSKGWKLTTLYAFKGSPDAASPYGGVIEDAAGNLYGTTYYGGADGLGSVYELMPNSKGRYRERVLYSFQGGSDGSASTSTLVFGTSGVLYGTTSAGGGSCHCGTIFKVDARSGQEQVLHGFGAGKDGAYPYYGLTSDGAGSFYGTTVAGGSFNQGVVFEFGP